MARAPSPLTRRDQQRSDALANLVFVAGLAAWTLTAIGIALHIADNSPSAAAEVSQ